MGVNWQAALYDVLGILVPGVLALLLGQMMLGPFGREFWANAVLALPAAYVAGHVVQGASRLLFTRLDMLVAAKSTWDTHGLRNAVRDAAVHYYRDVVPSETVVNRLFDFCYSPVADRLDSYKLFISLADFSRGLALLAALASVEFGCAAFGALDAAIPHPTWLAVVGFASMFLFWHRSRFFRSHAYTVVYFSFLSYVSATRHSETEECK